MSAENSGPLAAYLRFLGEGRFMLQRSATSGQHVFYPRVAVPGSGEADLEWVAASGDGIVYSTTIQRNRPPTPDTNLVLIELAEGPRLLSRVDGIAPDQVRIGMAVRAKIIDEGAGPFVVFEPAAAGTP